MKSILQKIILPIKIFARPVVWKGLDFYERYLSRKGKKVKEFDRIVKSTNVYFTASITRNGFTDQLMILKFFYKLGRIMGLIYHHSSPVSIRSSPTNDKNGDSPELQNEHSPYSDIYDFLGVNSYLNGLSDSLPSSVLDDTVINLDEMEFEKRHYSSYDNLVFELKSRIFDHLNPNKNNLIRFKGSPSVFFLYRLSVPFTKHDLSFREIYLEERKKSPLKSQFKEDKIKLMVHIRQGDTAIIETPWNTFIPVWYKMGKRYSEVENPKDLEFEYEVIGVEIYYNFLKDLFEHVDHQMFSALIFSDGFRSAFKEIFNSPISLTGSERKELENLEETYDEKQFKDLLEWSDVETIIGEEPGKLHDLVQSFLDADIVIFGTQAKMVPKLVALYCDTENMPLMINLYQKEEPHIEYLGIDHELERVIFVDANNYDMAQISNKILDYLYSIDKI